MARIFTAVAADYDRSGVDFFRVFAASLVDTLDPQPDWHLLDLGSGRGAVVFEITHRAQAPLRITAVDVAPGMVELLRADVADAGLDAVAVQLGVTRPQGCAVRQDVPTNAHRMRPSTHCGAGTFRRVPARTVEC